VSEPSVEARSAAEDVKSSWRPGDPDRRADRAGQEPGDLGIALTPSLIFGGFALLAAMVVLLRRRNRRDSKG
jgi:hypothetical protein